MVADIVIMAEKVPILATQRDFLGNDHVKLSTLVVMFVFVFTTRVVAKRVIAVPHGVISRRMKY